MVQKIYPWGVILVQSFPPHAGHFSEMFWQHNCPVVKIIHELFKWGHANKVVVVYLF